MKLSNPLPRTAKGQMRCYDCRRTLPIKDGDWHDRGNQQVFLCKTCDKEQAEARHKPFLS